MEEMKQCPKCHQGCPYYTSECSCGHRFPAVYTSNPPSGSTIIGLCSIMTGMGVLVSIGVGVFLVFQGNLILGLLVGAAGAVFNLGLTKVFDEVNHSIRARNTAEHHTE